MNTPEECANMGQIGYWNANSFPVQWQSSKANRGAVTIEAGKPVIGRNGELVAYDDDLEIQVKSRFLSRIIPGSPKYKEFKASNAGASKRRTTPTMPADQAAIQAQAEAAKAKAKATQPSPVTADGFGAGELPDGAVLNVNGTINFKGRTFTGIAALHAFLDSAS